MCRSQGNAITSYCKRKFLPHKQSKSHKNIYRAFSITQRLKWTVWGPILHKQPDIDQLRLVGQHQSTSAGSHINNNILRKGRAWAPTRRGIPPCQIKLVVDVVTKSYRLRECQFYSIQSKKERRKKLLRDMRNNARKNRIMRNVPGRRGGGGGT